MNVIKGSLRGSVTALLILGLILYISGSCQAKAYHHEHTGCDTIHRILNGTTTGATSHHATGEGFLIDHDQWHNHKDLGSICRGRCCSNHGESELARRSKHHFSQTLRHHTKSLRSRMVTTAKHYREHVMQLSAQSENKTLHIFSQIYGRLAPFARSAVADLYGNIRSRLRRVAGEDTEDIEKVVQNFFVEFFPVVYHHVLLSEDGGSTGVASTKDFHSDYKKCIKHTYEDVSPFGDVPRNLARSLQHSVGAAAVFLRSLEHGAGLLESVEQLDESHFGGKCSAHLVKMHYCQECDGTRKVKSCQGYCLNVMRGCLTQFVGTLDRPWASFALAVEQLLHMVRSTEGIESVLRSLDGHLSEAIMQAMQNGPHLEKKVRQLCGSPSMVAAKPYSNSAASGNSPSAALQPVAESNVIPMDAEMIQFLVTIENSQEFYSNIVNSYCDDNDFQQDDKNCWTGDRVSEYTNTVMPTGISSQKYNPEVPYSADEFNSNYAANELGDKLTNLKQSISIAMTKYSFRLDQQDHTSDNEMQSDMAEGSASWADGDHFEDAFPEASGSGHGPEEKTVHETSPPRVTPMPVNPKVIPNTDTSFGLSLHNCRWTSAMVLVSSAAAASAFLMVMRR